MVKARRIAGLLACCWIGATALARGDDPEAIWRCPYTQDGACIPNPRSYGYYPTRWRKWPGVKPPSAAEAISTPTPAKPTDTKSAPSTEELPPQEDRTPADTMPDTDDQGPQSPPTGPALPPDTLPTDPTAPAELPDTLPPDTTRPPTRPAAEPKLPPELNRDLPQPPNLENLLPDESSDEPPLPPASSSEDPSAIPADEDPFKDDPLPEGEDSRGGMHRRPPATSVGRSQRIRWRPDPRLQRTSGIAGGGGRVVLAAAQGTPAPIVTDTTMPLVKPALSRSNPLRNTGSLLPTPLEDDETSTATESPASSTASQTPPAQASPPGLRTNPLRSAR